MGIAAAAAVFHVQQTTTGATRNMNTIHYVAAE